MRRPSIAVYTATFNNYDVILPPRMPNNDVDFFCFTDAGCSVPLPYITITEGFERSLNDKFDTIRLKALGHEILKKYDILVWIDGNIRVIGEIRPFITNLVKNGDIFTNKHRSRNCIYEEANECIKLNKVNEASAQLVVSKYKSKGFPEDFGLHETTVLVRVQKNKEIQEFNYLWWKEFESGAHRDQLSFDYVRWSLGLDIKQLGADYFGAGNMFLKLPHVPKSMINRYKLWRIICGFKSNPSKYLSFVGKMLVSITVRLS